MVETAIGSLTDLHVCSWGRIRGSDAVDAGVMTQRLFAIHSGLHPPRKGVGPFRIGRPVTSDAHKPSFGFPSWHFRAVGKLVGNCTRHPAQMARASEEDSGTQWDSLARSLISEDAARRKSSRRERSTRQWGSGGRRPAGGAGCRAMATDPNEATALRMTRARSVAGPTTPSEHSAGRTVSQDGLTLIQEEGQMDRCLHVTGTGLGQDAGPIRQPWDGAPT